MKKILVLLMSVGIISACNQEPKTETNPEMANAQYFGDSITAENAIPVAQMLVDMGNAAEMPSKIEGTVLEVCQKKGCWMNLEKGDGTKMRVTFKDYGFFVPKDITGRKVILNGKAFVETTSVDDLRHYAEDEGKSKEEIEKITEPVNEISFEADGVILI